MPSARHALRDVYKRQKQLTSVVELVHNSGPMMNKVVFGKEIRCLKDKAMGQYGLEMCIRDSHGTDCQRAVRADDYLEGE